MTPLRSVVLAAFFLLTCGQRTLATGLDANAKDRAKFYQEEAVKLLSEYRWTIARNKPGQFTAVHDAFPGGAQFGGRAVYRTEAGDNAFDMRFHLTVSFQPVSASRTNCMARLVMYARNPFAEKSKDGKPALLGPAPANSPQMTKYVRNKLAAAEKRMARKHPSLA